MFEIRITTGSQFADDYLTDEARRLIEESEGKALALRREKFKEELKKVRQEIEQYSQDAKKEWVVLDELMHDADFRAKLNKWNEAKDKYKSLNEEIEKKEMEAYNIEQLIKDIERNEK